MKKIMIPFCMLLSIAALAQKEGKIIYERTIQMRRVMNQNADPGEREIRMPDARTDNYELLFGNNQALWRNLPSVDGGESSFSSRGGTEVVRVMNMNEESYFNIPEGKRVDKRELLSREFLIDDTIAKLNWKFVDETKTILGHTARKAIAQRIGTRFITSMENGEFKRQEVADTASVVAWFTSALPVSVGPAEFQGQLPGVILELSLNNGRTVYKAVEISPKVSLSSIKAPKGNKRLTQAEFVIERNKMMDEMRKNAPPGANFQIRN